MSVNRPDPAELEIAAAAVELMVQRGGDSWSDDDRALLLAYGSDLLTSPGERQDRFAALYEAALRGFFHCAADGVAFVPVERFEDEFAESIHSTYQGGSAAFLRLCRAYWTLHMLEGRVRLRYAGLALQQLLLAVDVKVAEAWFPETDLDDDAVEALVAEQRRLVLESGAAIDMDELLFGNPMLMGNPLG